MTAVKASLASGYDVRVARTVEELEELRPAWLELQGTRVTSDPDYYRTLLDSEPHIIRPHVVLLEKDGAPWGMVIGRIEERTIACRIGYKQVYAPRVRSLTVSYGGFLGPAPQEDAVVVVEQLRDALARREADVVYALHVRLDSPVHAAAAKGSILTRQHALQPEVHWRLDLPGSFEDFLATKSGRSRGRIRRYGKRLRDTYGDDFAIKVFMTPDEIDLMFRDAEAVSTKTYQHGLGVGFKDDPLQRNLVGLSLERGWFRGYVLYLEGAPRAFWFGTVYNGTFHTGPTGFDPEYGDYHPGTFLLVRMIQDMCDDNAVDVIDYGFGDAEYKQTFGSENWLEHDVLIFASSPRAVRVNVVRTAVLGADALARRILGRRNLVSRLKRRWRNRLAPDER